MKPVIVISVVAMVVAAAFFVRSSRTEKQSSLTTEEARSEGTKPVLIELGANRCTSCRAMVSVLEELKGAHACSLDIKSVDVWANPDEGDRFDVTIIPTQILLAPDGKELARHTGFWSVDMIRDAYASNGYALANDTENCKP